MTYNVFSGTLKVNPTLLLHVSAASYCPELQSVLTECSEYWWHSSVTIEQGPWIILCKNFGNSAQGFC